MMKFFRKYTKHLLAVFMALLLVVWLGGPALRSQFDPRYGDEVQARAFGRDITASDKTRFDNETRLLDRLGYKWASLRMLSTASGSEPFEPVDWYLLRQEARNLGIVIPDEQVDKILKPIPAQMMQSIRGGRNGNVSVEAIRQTVADLSRVYHAAALSTDAVRISEPQLRQMARQSLERVRVRFIALPATSFFDGREKLSDAEVQAHFEKYKNRQPDSSKADGYGYQIPTRVTVQYIMAKIDDAVAEIHPPIVVSEDDARKYYTEHKTSYIRPPERKAPQRSPSTQPTSARPAPSASKPVAVPASGPSPQPRSKPATAVKGAVVYAQEMNPTTTAPRKRAAAKLAPTPPATSAPRTGRRTSTRAAAGGPAARKPVQPQYKPFEEVRAEIENQIRRERATEKVVEVMTRVRDALVRVSGWYGAKRDAEGYPIAPPTAADLGHYDKVLGAIQKRWKLAKTFKTGTTEPFAATFSKAARVPKLGRGRPAEPGVRVGGFSTLVQKVQGVSPYPKNDPKADTTLYLGLYQTCPIVLKDDQTGNVFLFRVIHVEPAHAPATLGEVRLLVEANLRKLHSYRRAEAAGRSLLAVAREKGILAAYASLPEGLRKQVRVSSPPPFARITRRARPPTRFGPAGMIESPSSVPGIYGSAESRQHFIEACFALGEATTTRPSDQRVRLVGRPDARQWVLVEWVETLPMRRDEYEKTRDQLLTMLRQEQQIEIQRNWFDRKNLRKRTGYKEERPREEEKDGAAGDAAAG